jgi:CHAT domain
MSRVALEVSSGQNRIIFANGTQIESIAGTGTATQFVPSARGLRSADNPSEIDTSPLFERALVDTGIYEQETIHLEVLPIEGLRSGTSEDTIVLRPAVPVGDPHPRVVLYQDDSGGLSWHFAEDSLLTEAQGEVLRRRGLLRAPGPPEFVIPSRTPAARASLLRGPPRGALRGMITKIGRKVFKIFVLPVGGMILANPIQELVGAIESRIRANRVWQLTADTYAKGPTADWANWAALDGKPTLLVVHGVLSSVEGMLSLLPRSALERWLQNYEGRVIGFNHVSVTLSPEENARFFLEQAKAALPNGRFQFDVLSHSRGGIVARAMAERGAEIFPELNCEFRKVYFAASPNSGSTLADPEHIVDMLDVFTNLLTELPDNETTYVIEAILGIIKLLAYTVEKYLPGIETMGSKSYIANVLNKGMRPSSAKYSGAAARYSPGLSLDNGFFTGYFASSIMGRIFENEGKGVSNDLVVPRDGVFARNGHPSFPILSPLIYEDSDLVYHTTFFREPRTIAHIEKFFEIPNGPTMEFGDQTVASIRALRGGREGGEFAGHLRGGGGFDSTGVADEGPGPSPALEAAKREPEISFHEVVSEGNSDDLSVRLSDIAEARNLDNLIELQFAPGEDEIQLTVELSAVGFSINGSHSAEMRIKQKRDPCTEEVKFRLTANTPGKQPVMRTIIATFFRGNECVGGVTHYTTVVPAGYSGSVMPGPPSIPLPVQLPPVSRENAELIIFVREDQAQSDVFEIALQSAIPGEEYAMRDVGVMKLAGTEFSNFFSKTIDPQFQTFPTDPKLTDQEFDEKLSKWNAAFITRLKDLGRTLWGYLPQTFREEYLRLMAGPRPPRSVCIFSDEMILPWELLRPSGNIDGGFKELPPFGVSHIMGRWKPGLGVLPQPQALRVQKMILFTPQYGAAPLYWADKESDELVKMIAGVERPATVDRKAIDAVLNGTGAQLVHFNGHGDWDSLSDLSALHLANGESIPAMAFVGRTLGMTTHPMLYLNACSVGRAATNVGRPGGFAAKCLEGGWSGIVAPYWRVYDPWAKDMCIRFYGKLKLGISIGEALQQLRRDYPDDFTAQSFAYFGDPNARLLLQ